MAERDLIVRIVGDDRSLRRAFQRSEKQAKGFTAAMKVSAGTIVKGGLIFGATTTAMNLLGSAVRASVQEFSDQQKAAAQTNAVLRSTAGAAGVTAEHVDRLAAAISNYSGQDDEAIQAGENLLLTFTHIRNEVGKGNNIFDQATVAVSDLAVAMGIDNTRAALQLGKALNDPVRGYARLQRIGVQFTAAQIEQIKNFAAAGREMDAQRVILEELNKEFGGSARAIGKTLPGQIAILQERLRNLGGALAKLGARLLIFFTRQFTIALGQAILLLEKVTEAATHIPLIGDKFKGVHSALAGARSGVDDFNNALATTTLLGDQVVSTFGALPGIAETLAKVADKFGPKAEKDTKAVKAFQIPGPLRLAEARAQITRTISDDLEVARKIRDHINGLIASGKLKGQRLIDALGELGAANSLIADAQKDAADAQKDAAEKTKTAAEKHAAAVKAAAEKQRDAAKAAADRIRQATDSFRSQIGELFAGPSEAARRAALGFPGVNARSLVTGQRAQVNEFLAFQKMLAQLARRGAPGALISELRGRGPEVGPQVQALLADRQAARQFFAEFRRGQTAARRAAERPLRVFLTVNLDGRQVATSVTTHQQKQARGHGRSRRGNTGGQVLAVG